MYFQFIGRSPLLSVSNGHTHDSWEIILNAQGRGQTQIDGQLFTFEPGTVTCIPPGITHSKQAEDGFMDLFILFPSLSLERRVSVFHDEDGQIEQLMTLIHSTFHRRGTNHHAIADHLAQALEQLVLSRLQTTPIDPRVARLADLAVEHFTDPDFSMAQAMQESGYCPDHLRRLFRQQFGQSPLEYLTGLRIRFAKRLLRENGRMHYSVTQIAAMSGFSDVCYFSRLFRKQVGLSPRDYMKP